MGYPKEIEDRISNGDGRFAEAARQPAKTPREEKIEEAAQNLLELRAWKILRTPKNGSLPKSLISFYETQKEKCWKALEESLK